MAAAVRNDDYDEAAACVADCEESQSDCFASGVPRATCEVDFNVCTDGCDSCVGDDS